VLTRLARQGAEKYIDAQKKLVELGIEQLETVGKANGSRKIGAGKSARRPWGELTEKTVKNFVAAEKSLLDLTSKPKKGIAHEEIRRTSHRSHGRIVHARRRRTAEGGAAVAA